MNWYDCRTRVWIEKYGCKKPITNSKKLFWLLPWKLFKTFFSKLNASHQVWVRIVVSTTVFSNCVQVPENAYTWRYAQRYVYDVPHLTGKKINLSSRETVADEMDLLLLTPLNSYFFLWEIFRFTRTESFPRFLRVRLNRYALESIRPVVNDFFYTDETSNTLRMCVRPK